MKKKLITTGIAVLAVSTGIITYMVSAQPDKSLEAPKNNVENVVSQPEIEEERPILTEQNVDVTYPEERVAPTVTPEQAPAHISREELSTTAITLVSAQWNAKTSGIMISSSNITQLIIRSYDASPESFTASTTEGIITSCIERIKTMNQEEAMRFVGSDTCF